MKNIDRKPPGYWTEERAKEEAKNYESRKEFKHKCPGAYEFLRRRKCLDECGFDGGRKLRKPKGYWNKDRCLSEMDKFDTISQFQKHSPGAFKSAYVHGWIYEKEWKDGRVLSGRRKTKWTRDECKNVAMECVSRGDFYKKFPSAYYKAWKEGWLDDYTWFSPKENLLVTSGKVYSYEFSDKHVYVGITFRDITVRDKEHRSDERSAVYKHSKMTRIDIPEIKILKTACSISEARQGEHDFEEKYINDGYIELNKAKTGIYSSSVGKLNSIKWTKQHVYDLAKSCRTRVELKRKSSQAYKVAIRNGWIDDFSWFVNGHKLVYETGRRKAITRDECYEVAKTCKGRTELSRRNGSVYKSAMRNGWINDYTWFKFKTRTKWTFDRCKEIGLKCGSRTRFQQNHQCGYNAARRNGWLDLIFGKKKKN